MANTRREQAAEHISDTLGANYDTVFHNLQWASPGELIWAQDANAASLRAAARMNPDRYGPPDKLVNPFWYHNPPPH